MNQKLSYFITKVYPFEPKDVSFIADGPIRLLIVTLSHSSTSRTFKPKPPSFLDKQTCDDSTLAPIGMLAFWGWNSNTWKLNQIWKEEKAYTRRTNPTKPKITKDLASYVLWLLICLTYDRLYTKNCNVPAAATFLILCVCANPCICVNVLLRSRGRSGNWSYRVRGGED